MEKKCIKCFKVKNVDDFKKSKVCKDGYSNICRICSNESQRKYRDLNDNITTKKYEKTKNGFIMRLYRNMLSRISGVQKEKYHLYKGKNLLDKDVFYSWSLNNKDFNSLFIQYEHSNYNRKLAPSVDRIDSSKGYDIDNMEFITMSENSRRGAINKRIISFKKNGKIL